MKKSESRRGSETSGRANATTSHVDGAIDELTTRARGQGFSCCGRVPAGELVVKPAVRSMCAEDRCRSYGRNWMCPPACGTLDDFAAALASRSTCLVVQTVERLEDEFDIEGMMAAEQAHKERFEALAQEALDAFGDAEARNAAPAQQDTFEAAGARRNALGSSSIGPDALGPLPLSAGTCTLCPTCSCPDAPCRHPARALISMEAAGLLVSEVCEAAGIPYYHGKGTISFTSCILL